MNQLDLKVIIPVECRNLSIREKSIHLLLTSLNRSINLSKSTRKINCHVEIAVNGDEENYAEAKSSAFTRKVLHFKVDVKYYGDIGKIGVVNANIDASSNYLCFIDDDIILPIEFYDEVIIFAKRTSTSKKVLCFYKTSVSFDLNSDFQKRMAYFFSGTCQRLLSTHIDSYFIKPTGACYCLRPPMVKFPNPCNEGDVFELGDYKLSNYPVKSYYPTNKNAEIERRKRQYLTYRSSSLSSHSQFKSASFSDLNSKDINNMPIEDKIKKNIIKSLNLLKEILKYGRNQK